MFPPCSINPITGVVEEEQPDPMEGMTEEEKEYEAMKLVSLFDKLSRLIKHTHTHTQDDHCAVSALLSFTRKTLFYCTVYEYSVNLLNISEGLFHRFQQKQTKVPPPLPAGPTWSSPCSSGWMGRWEKWLRRIWTNRPTILRSSLKRQRTQTVKLRVRKRELNLLEYLF